MSVPSKLAFSQWNADLPQIQGKTMGTTYKIKWSEQEAVAPAEILEKVDARLRQINKLMSTYDSESELSRFNASKETEWFAVSPETVTVVEAAQKVSQLSGGAFDPTVGRLVRLWNFGPSPRSPDPPTAEVLQAAMDSVGFQYISVRQSPPALKKSHPDTELDLSAIAKGYAVDEVMKLVNSMGIANCMVEIGGEVRTSGTKKGQAWKLGIERPDKLERAVHSIVELNDQALATSGDYRNYFESDGKTYSHTIDPRTGKPVTHGLASVSIVAEDCMSADAWATTLMVLGPDAGLKLADEQGIAAYLLLRQGNQFKELSSQTVAAQFVNLTQASQEPKDNMSPLLSTFLIAMAVFSIAIVGLAVGVILANRPLKGSCGGVEGLKDEDGKSICELCTTPPEECDKFKEQLRAQAAQDEIANGS